MRPYHQLTLKANVITPKTLSERVGADKGKLIPTDIGSVVNDFSRKPFRYHNGL